MIRSSAFQMVVMTLAAASLAACDPGSGGNATSGAVTVSGLPYEATTKLSGYVGALRDIDLAKQRADYAELGLADAKAGDTAYIDAGTIARLREDLERARGADGTLPDIDPAADRLLAALRKLETRAAGLASYFTMRSYLDDGFARARREDSPLLAEFDAAIAALAQFRALIDQAETRNEAVVLPWLKSEGRMAEYHEGRIAQQARALRHATEEAAIDDPARIARADQIVAGLPPMLDEARAARKAEAAKPDAAPDSGVVTAAERMIGSYREMRQSKKPEDRRDTRQAIDSVLMLAAN